MAHLTDHVALPVYPAAERIVSRVLRGSTSLLSPRRPLWREPGLRSLRDRLGHAASDGTGTFVQRLDGALSDADDDTIQLAAEALYVHLVIAGDVLPGTKRALVETTLARMERPPHVPGEIAAALEGGLTPTAGAFTRRRLSQLLFLATAALAWREAAPRDRRAALECPWTFRTWLWTVEVGGGQAQREALLHLVHPATYEAIVSREAKRRIADAFGEPPVEGDLDRTLLALRARLAASHGAGFSFFAPPLAALWR
jgi:5-methylcytosine-specific restriction enzyme B